MITSKSLEKVILKRATPHYGGTYTYYELRNLQQPRRDRCAAYILSGLVVDRAETLLRLERET